MIYHTFASLREQTALSEKMREYHRMMTKALLFQVKMAYESFFEIHF